MNNKRQTILELQKEFEDAIHEVNGHATVDHTGECTQGNRVLYKSSTQVTLPEGMNLKPMVPKFKAVIEEFYAPVLRVQIEKPHHNGCDEIPGRLWQTIVFIHE